MSAWSGDLTMGTEENPLNAHMDFHNLTVKIPGGVEKLIGHRSADTEVIGLKIYDPEKSDNINMGLVNYATSGPCGYKKADGSACTDTAIYVNSEAEMVSWFKNYTDLSTSSRLKCLKVTTPFSAVITQQINGNFNLQPKHYNFGGATISHSMSYLLPAPTASATVANLTARVTGTGIVSGIVNNLECNYSVIENCTTIFYGNVTTGGNMAGGITSQTWPSSSLKNCKTIIESNATVDFKGTLQGGLVGYSHGEILNCRTEIHPSANVRIYSISWGGLAGFGSQSVKIENSSALVNIDYAGRPNMHSGGLIGQIDNGGQADSSYVKNSYSEGNSLQVVRYAGGIVGAANRGTKFTNCRSYIKQIYGVFSQFYPTESVCMGGIVGIVQALSSGMVFDDCVSLTETYSDRGTNKLNGNWGGYCGGVVGMLMNTSHYVNFNKIKVYIDTVNTGSERGVAYGGFAGESNGQLGGSGLANSSLYVKRLVHHGTGDGFNSHRGILLGAGHTNVNVAMSGMTYYNNGAWMDGLHGIDYSDRPTTSIWPASASAAFGAAAVSPTANTLNGSSIGSESATVKIVELVFNGLGTTYDIENMWISVNYHSKPSQGTYTQIIYKGKLLGNINATNYVGGTGTVIPPGATVPVREKLVFKYTAPVSYADVVVRFTIKSASGRRSFVFYGLNSQWSEIPSVGL